METIKEILNQLKAIDINDSNQPINTEPIEFYEVLPEKINDDAKRLYILAEKFRIEEQEIKKRHKEICPPTKKQKEQHDQLLLEKYILKEKINVVEALLWIEIHKQFPQLGNKLRTAIFAGWQVGYNKIFPDALTLGKIISD